MADRTRALLLNESENNVNKLQKFCGLAVAISLLAGTSFGAPFTRIDQDAKTKLAHLLDKSGYKFTKVADNVWTVPFNGKSLGEFPLLVTSVQDLIIVGVVVAKKDSMRLSPEMLQKLLRMANDLDRVKIGIDDDGDLFLRVEVSARLFDAEELKVNFEQVAAAANDLHAAIKSFLK